MSLVGESSAGERGTLEARPKNLLPESGTLVPVGRRIRHRTSRDGVSQGLFVALLESRASSSCYVESFRIRFLDFSFVFVKLDFSCGVFWQLSSAP